MNYPEYVYKGSAQYSNSFGEGSYFSFNKEIAREYGNVNQYSINYDNLNILDLRKMNLANWISVVATNREINITPNLKLPELDISGYDIVIGYRSDNSNLIALKKCLKGNITKSFLSVVLNVDDRNTEICIKSERALNQVKFIKVISKNDIEPINDLATRNVLRIPPNYELDFICMLSEYFACFLEKGKSYDYAYNKLIDSGIYKRFNGRFMAGTTGSELYKMCTGNTYKNFETSRHDYHVVKLIIQYMKDNNCTLDTLRNNGITIASLIQDNEVHNII